MATGAEAAGAEAFAPFFFLLNLEDRELNSDFLLVFSDSLEGIVDNDLPSLLTEVLLRSCKSFRSIDFRVRVEERLEDLLLFFDIVLDKEPGGGCCCCCCCCA